MAKATRGIQTTVSIKTGYSTFQEAVEDLKAWSKLPTNKRGQLTRKLRMYQGDIERMYGSMSRTDEQHHETDLKNLKAFWANQPVDERELTV